MLYISEQTSGINDGFETICTLEGDLLGSFEKVDVEERLRCLGWLKSKI